MAENRINLQRYAMHFGTSMGVYWIAKFVLFPMGFSNMFLMLLFFVLTIAVPFLGYFYTRTFRDKYCGGNITFAQAWIFTVFMYLFAGLLTAVAHYIYFRYIDNGYILDAYAKLFEQSQKTPEVAEVLEHYQYKEVIELARAMTPIEITMQLFSQNMLFGSFIALITAPFITRKQPSPNLPQ